MRNLKRALSLALATIMVSSVMIVGAGAASYDDFSDKDEIVNKEAVQMLVELGVINGKDTGDFDPTGIVTRAEMAKMICVVLNGGKDPSLGTTVTNSYTDTVGHWAAGYIEYCTQLGIVAGDGTGKFNPNATVTGSEAAKMLLVALGYKSEIEGFTGANWALAVNTRGSQKGLYNGLDIVVDQGLTRDNAAQMIYNALDANMVEYAYTLITDGSSLSSSPTLKDKVNNDGNTVTLLEDRFNAVKVEGIVVSNEVANLNTNGSADAGKTVIAVTNDDDQSTYSGNETFSISTGMEDLGRAVVLYAKKESNSAKAEIYGSAITSDDNKVVVDYSSDSIADVADDNNLNIINSTTKVAVNYGNAVAYGDYSDPKTAGIEKILIDNDDDGDVEYVIMNTYQFGKVTSYVTSGDGSITVRADSTFSKSDKDDVVGFDDVAKNDYVTAIEIAGKLYVAKAETVTGVMEAYKTSDGLVSKLTVDGTDYNVSAIAGYTGGEDDIKAASDYGKDNLDVEATFYLTQGGYIAAVGDVAATAYNYALVLATGTTGLEDRVRVALSDGTVATYDYTSNSDKPENGHVYSYSINSSKQIRLTKVADDNTKALDTSLTFKKGLTTIKADEATVYANSNTAFFYVKADSLPTDNNTTIDSDAVSVYTGYASAPSLDKDVKAVVYTRGDKNSTRAAAVVFYNDSLTTTEVDDTLYITSVGTTTSDYTNATAFIAGSTEAQSIKVDSGSAVSSKTAYTYTVNSDGYYELSIAKYDDTNRITSGTVSSANSNTFVVGSKEFKITSDTLFVDHSAYLDSAVAELGAGPDVDDVIRYVIFNSDNEAILVVIANPEAGAQDGNTSTEYKANAKLNGSDIEVRYYGTQPSSTQLKTLIQKAGVGSDVTDISWAKASVKVDDVEYGLKAIPVYAVKVNDAEVAYKDANSEITLAGDFYTTDGGKKFVAVSGNYTVTGDVTILDGYYEVSITDLADTTSKITSGQYLKGKGTVVFTMTDDNTAIAGTETTVDVDVTGATEGEATLSNVSDASATVTVTVTDVTGAVTITVNSIS